MRAIWILALATSAAFPALADQPIKADIPTVSAINSICHDYIDVQMQGDVIRVAASLHPDLAKRTVIGETPYERLGLRRMTKEELVSLTKRGVLRTQESEWDRTCTILDVTGNAASVRLETPWFVDYFHMGNLDGQWLIINALWISKS